MIGKICDVVFLKFDFRLKFVKSIHLLDPNLCKMKVKLYAYENSSSVHHCLIFVQVLLFSQENHIYGANVLRATHLNL